MGGVSNHCLVEIADLHQDAAFGVRQRAQVSQMAVTANPDWRPVRQIASGAAFQPLVKPFGTATDESMRRPCHLEIANCGQNLWSVARINHFVPFLVQLSNDRFEHGGPPKARICTNNRLPEFPTWRG